MNVGLYGGCCDGTIDRVCFGHTCIDGDLAYYTVYALSIHVIKSYLRGRIDPAVASKASKGLLALLSGAAGGQCYGDGGVVEGLWENIVDDGVLRLALTMYAVDRLSMIALRLLSLRTILLESHVITCKVLRGLEELLGRATRRLIEILSWTLKAGDECMIRELEPGRIINALYEVFMIIKASKRIIKALEGAADEIGSGCECRRELARGVEADGEVLDDIIRGLNSLKREIMDTLRMLTTLKS